MMKRLWIEWFDKTRRSFGTKESLSLFLLSGGCIFLVMSCSKPERTDGEYVEPSFRVATYNLTDFSLTDRNLDGLPNEDKPEEEKQAVYKIIQQVDADVLALQGIGKQDQFETLMLGLKEQGIEYPHLVFLQTKHSPLNLALLSRFPVSNVVEHTNDVYSADFVSLPVTHGYIQAEINVSDAQVFTIFVADLKSKDFHPQGQTEMRRTEGRILNKHVRTVLRETPEMPVIVAGSFHDQLSSSSVRAVTGEEETLTDLQISDPAGDFWTVYDSEDEVYRREDFIFVNKTMRYDSTPENAYIFRSPEAKLASDHRPVIASFTKRPEQKVKEQK